MLMGVRMVLLEVVRLLLMLLLVVLLLSLHSLMTVVRLRGMVGRWAYTGPGRHLALRCGRA
jgi:hypothetical protein